MFNLKVGLLELGQLLKNCDLLRLHGLQMYQITSTKSENIIDFNNNHLSITTFQNSRWHTYLRMSTFN